MKATDKTILIECSECPGHHYEEGMEDMVNHIKADHPNYTPLEAIEYAARWMQAAYDREEKFLQNYYEERQIDRAIEADREFQTHKI